jgi:hypothetical protein
VRASPPLTAGLEDPEEFFTELGEQADAEIEDRYLEYAGPDIAEGERATAAEAEQRAQAAEADRTEWLTYAIRTTLTWAG